MGPLAYNDSASESGLHELGADFKKVDASPKLRDIILRSRGRYRNIQARFLENYLTYSSKAQLYIEFRLPKLAASFKTSLSLFFDHSDYDSVNQEVVSVDLKGD